MKRSGFKIKRNKPLKRCKTCKKDFVKKLYPSSKKSGHKGIYCSMDCMVRFMKINSFNFPCKICSKAIYVQPTQLKYRARSTCSIECRRKLARKRAEERRIKFGYTKHQLDRLARYSIEANHIQPFAYFPELRYEMSNGRTLCRPCHDKTKVNYKVMRKIYAKN